MGKATPHEPNRKLAQAKCRHDVSNVACSLYILPTTVLLHVLGSPYVIGGPGSRAWGKASEPLEGYIGSLGATTSTLPHNLPGREDESARRKILWIAPSLLQTDGRRLSARGEVEAACLSCERWAGLGPTPRSQPSSEKRTKYVRRRLCVSGVT